MRRVQPDSLHIHYSLIDSLPVRWAQKQNLKISSYTINDKAIYQNIKTLIFTVGAAKLGVEGRVAPNPH